MDSQDFEAYAEFKPFNTNVAETWDAALCEAFRLVGEPLQEVRLLDYGCGDGKYFNHLISKGMQSANIYGLDISKTRVARCQQLGWINAGLIVPFKPLPFETGGFDIVNCMEVVEHIPAVEGVRIIAELRRVLRPGGVLLISTPNYPIKRFYDCCDAVFHGKWGRLRDDPTHVTRFNHERLNRLLSEYFQYVDPWPFKPGFLYKRIPRPFFLHKMFFLCRA
jgi:2-polyprenyl-3-methyl-5-hydroxy-6-metoxy-1,4-benzoquinol methylase